MNNIPKKLKDEILSDPFYKRCCITGVLSTNEKVEWHHNFIYAGRQLQEKWCILPIAEKIHKNIDKYLDQCDRIMLNRATDEQLKKYSKCVDLIAKRDWLNKKYGSLRH
jgi:hypothetical protein